MRLGPSQEDWVIQRISTGGGNPHPETELEIHTMREDDLSLKKFLFVSLHHHPESKPAREEGLIECVHRSRELAPDGIADGEPEVVKL